jgi:hypothetical protein
MEKKANSNNSKSKECNKKPSTKEELCNIINIVRKTDILANALYLSEKQRIKLLVTELKKHNISNIDNINIDLKNNRIYSLKDIYFHFDALTPDKKDYRRHIKHLLSEISAYERFVRIVHGEYKYTKLALLELAKMLNRNIEI